MKSVDFINNGVGKGYICPTCFDMYEWSDDGSCSCDIKKKSFNAPDGDKRLTINVSKDIHTKIKTAAINLNTTAGELIEELIEKHI